MNIAILGGSFDPPHKGHATIAKRLLKIFHFDQIWLMPLFRHPFSKNLLDSDERLKMTRCLGNANIKISDLEIKKKTISYTIDTLKFLAKKNPKDIFCWVIGTDQVNDFKKWKNWQEIISKFRIIVVPRTNFKKAKKQLKDIARQVNVPKNIVLVDKKKFTPIYVSSTLTRKKIKEKKLISNLVPRKVEEYIIQHRLYL